MYRDPAFFSSSTTREVTERFRDSGKLEPGNARVMFEIEKASGSNVRPMSMYATEDEILLSPELSSTLSTKINFLTEVTSSNSGRESRMQLCPSL